MVDRHQFEGAIGTLSTVPRLIFEEKSFDFLFKFYFRYWLYSFVVIARMSNLQPTTHGKNFVFILTSSDYFQFRAIKTSACFRMSN